MPLRRQLPAAGSHIWRVDVHEQKQRWDKLDPEWYTELARAVDELAPIADPLLSVLLHVEGYSRWRRKSQSRSSSASSPT